MYSYSEIILIYSRIFVSFCDTILKTLKNFNEHNRLIIINYSVLIINFT